MLKNSEKKLKTTIHNSPVVASTWSYGNNKLINELKAGELFYKYVEKLVNKNHKGKITMLFLLADKEGNPAKWKNVTGGFQNIRNGLEYVREDDEYWNSHVHDEDETLHILSVQIQVTKDKSPVSGAGGKDRYNDCFYKCLEQLIPTILKKEFPTPESLKEYCGLNRNSLIPVDKVQMIEDKLPNCKINISGDDVYNSTKSALNTINIELSFEHYEIIPNMINYMKGVSIKEKPPLIYRYLPNEPKYVECYDGKIIEKKKYSLIIKWLQNPKYDVSPFTLIPFDGKDFKEQYDQFIIDADILKEKTNGKYNLYKCGKITRVITNRFFELNPCLIPDPITKLEADWFSGCHMGGLVWGNTGYKGEAWKYDINSAYPYVISHHLFSFPIKQGVFKQLTQKEFDNLKYYEFGIYRATINGDKKHIPVNKKYYVHFDLERAKELGYKIKLIEDGNPNVLSYAGPNMRVSGTVFKEIVDELYENKKTIGDDYKIFKKLLLRLWGTLCERNTKSTFVYDGTTYNVPNNMKCLSIKEIGKNESVKMQNNSDQFVYGFARLGPFLLSRARCMMSRIIENDIDNIVRVYVDGIMSKKKLNFVRKNKSRMDNVTMGIELGNMKCEGYNPKILIQNCHRVVDMSTGKKVDDKTGWKKL
jgi:hypothetical protein